MNTHEPTLDHRARIERAQLEAAERRTQALIEQRSTQNTPAQRVRAWERLHQVSLPKDPAHAVLRVVAKQTGMALADVREVQRVRALPPQPEPAVPPESPEQAVIG
jgi:hypothetical protein